jgi:hypothetical protein
MDGRKPDGTEVLDNWYSDGGEIPSWVNPPRKQSTHEIARGRLALPEAHYYEGGRRRCEGAQYGHPEVEASYSAEREAAPEPYEDKNEIQRQRAGRSDVHHEFLLDPPWSA